MSVPPAFPDDVPTAIFDTIVLQKLIKGDVLEEQRLLKACKEEGFFYLDCRGVTTQTEEARMLNFPEYFTDIVQKTFGICIEVQNWPSELKAKYEKVPVDRVFGMLYRHG